MYLGLFGTYRKNETIDLQFSRDGKVELLSDLAVVPYPEAAHEHRLPPPLPTTARPSTASST